MGDGLRWLTVGHPGMGNTGRRAGLPIGRSGADTRDMSPDHIGTLRVAAVAETGVVAELLDAFNREYHTPTPGPAVLTGRLRRLLADGTVIAVLAGQPAIAIALLTLRPNVWYEGSVALLDELYVVPALRGQGIGSALLDRAEAVARQRGAEVLEINVDGEDVDARRFYERHGYTNTEPGQDEPMLYYYRRLRP
jgi:GNAT superfamily N-acetyltransferase